MKGIITVVGKDRVGIIAKVCTLLSEKYKHLRHFTNYCTRIL